MAMGDQTQRLAASIRGKLECLAAVTRKRCIYRVADYVRQVNEQAYRPLVVSIGPYFYCPDNPQLQVMQHQKLRHLQQFLQAGNINGHSLEDYINFVRGREEEAREYYAENFSHFSSDEFVNMLLFDAVFILEHLWSNFHIELDDDGDGGPFEVMVSTPEKQRNQLILEDNKWPYEVVCNEIGRDLLLEENQLPYFILQGLYELAFGKHNDQNCLIILTCKFILSFLWKDNIGGADVEGELTEKVVRMMGVSRDIRHLLDYLRIYLLPSSLETQLTDLHTDSSFATCLGLGKVSDILRPHCLGLGEPKNNAEFPKTASELSAAGVKFVAAKRRISLLDIEFNEGVLKIPNIIVQDTTESIFRSLMALEDYHSCSKTYFVDYIFFLDNLINTPQDVQVLVKNGIIDNLLGSNEAVANLFNNMTKNVALREDFYYTTVSQNLNQYASISWNRWKAVLKRDYFRHPWSTISVIYAIVLLILTILQTISGFSSQKIVVVIK